MECCASVEESRASMRKVAQVERKVARVAKEIAEVRKRFNYTQHLQLVVSLYLTHLQQ